MPQWRRSRFDDLAMWLIQEHGREGQNVGQRIGVRKDARVGRQPDYTGENLRRHSIRRFAVDYAFQPASICSMIFSVGTKRVEQHVYIR